MFYDSSGGGGKREAAKKNHIGAICEANTEIRTMRELKGNKDRIKISAQNLSLIYQSRRAMRVTQRVYSSLQREGKVEKDGVINPGDSGQRHNEREKDEK